MGGGGSSSGTTTQKTEPPEYALPYYKDIAAQAQTQSQQPMTYFPGQTYAPMSPESSMALDWQANRAVAGSPVTAASQADLTKTLSGGYLDPATNPYFNKAAEDIQGRIGGMFSGSGNWGGGAAQNQYRESLTDLAAKTYGDERTHMLQAQAFAPAAANQDYTDIGQLAAAGAGREGFAQQGINEAINRFNFGQMEPWQQLNLYQSILSGQPGGVVTASGSQPSASAGNRLLGAGAGALGGFGAASLLPAGMASGWAWPLILGGGALGLFGS